MSEFDKTLGLEHIADTNTKEMVRKHLETVLTPEQLKQLLHEKVQADLKNLKGRIEILNKREKKASAQEFIDEVMGFFLEHMRNQDLQNNYQYQGKDHLGYLPSFAQMVGTKGVNLPVYKGDEQSGFKLEWENAQAFRDCCDKVEAEAKRVPAKVDRELQHEYMQAYTLAYSQALKEVEHFWKKIDTESLKKADEELLKKFPYKDFADWFKNTKKDKKLEDTEFKVSPLDEVLIIDVQTKISAIRKLLPELDATDKEAFDKELRNIEDTIFTKPLEAQKNIGDLQKKVDEKKKLKDAAKQAEEAAKKAEVEADKALADQAEVDRQAAEAEAANAPQEEIPTFIDKVVLSGKNSQIGQLVQQIGKIPLVGGFILSMFLSGGTLKKLGISNNPDDMMQQIADKIPGLPKNPDEQKQIEAQAKTYLRQNFNIADLDKLGKLSVSELFKKMPEGMKEDKYTKLIGELTKNGAKKDAKDNVLVFVIAHIENWKK